MPIPVPALDDRRFDDLVEDLLARIPGHTPEWTNPRLGDPGRTLIELFAWLTETLLYRANLIPERQRLAFLRLLGVTMQPAQPAQGIVSLTFVNGDALRSVTLPAFCTLPNSPSFETTAEVTVLPVAAQAFCKRPLTSSEQTDMRATIAGLAQLYRVTSLPTPYFTAPVFPQGAANLGGFDLVAGTVDTCLWLALLAPKAKVLDAARAALDRAILNVGVVPSLAVDVAGTDGQASKRHVWEVCAFDSGDPLYVPLNLVGDDATSGLTRSGVVRLSLPPAVIMKAPNNDVRQYPQAGVGDTPPRLDDADQASRLITWIRLRPTETVQSLPLSWVGINAITIDQRATVTNRVIQSSDGTPRQTFVIASESIDPITLQIQVEEPNQGYIPWTAVPDLALAGRDDAVFQLDSEAGTITFGDGIRGRIPDAGMRVRVALMRTGGGAAGNVPAGTLKRITGTDLSGASLPSLSVMQPLALIGGTDTESLGDAEQRIPAYLRHGDRAVTANDYRQIVGGMPGSQIGRVEVLPRFKPQQRRSDVPGVLSVMVLPYADIAPAPNPRPDRPTLEAVQSYLEPRRPLATELYVIGCEYVPIGVGIAVTVLDGASQETVLNGVRDALRAFLWPLPPGGFMGTGWDLGRSVRDREIEVVAARVPGVDMVSGVTLFQQSSGAWSLLPTPAGNRPLEITLQPWQLPELQALMVIAGDTAPTDVLSLPNPNGTGVAIPVIPKVC